MSIQDWKTCYDCNQFVCNKNGAIMNVKTQKMCYISKDNTITYYHTGYKKYKTLKADRMIWQTFNGVIATNAIITHINGNNLDNALSNLTKNSCPMHPIIGKCKKRNILLSFYSMRNASQITGCSENDISKNCNVKSIKSITGWQWEFYDMPQLNCEEMKYAYSLIKK